MKLISFAKDLRKKSTDTETFLWRHLRARQLAGLKFRRQEPLGRYVVDFVCFEHRVIIECDGSQHMLQVKRDRERDRWFEAQGYRVLRFSDNEILQHIESVLQAILTACQSHGSPSL